MTISRKTAFPVLCLLLIGSPAVSAEKPGGKYVTAKGQLAAPLTVRDTQGGFAGFTGQTYSIKPDGSWTMTRVFNQRKFEPHSSGKLTGKQLKALGELLQKNKFLELPKEVGSRAQANPLLITVTFGKTKCVCALPAGLDNPAKLPKGKLGEVGRRVLAVRKFLRTNIKPNKKS